MGRIGPAVYETAAVATEPRRHEIGGSPRCCPALCGLRDRCIAAMLATLVPVRKDRDTKVELNHRSQACEGPGRHRYSRRVKWSERRVTLPLALAPEASASLLGYALKNSPAHRTRRPAITSTVRGLCQQTEFNWGKWLARPKPWRRLVEHLGIAPSIPAWKAGVYLSTPMLGKWSPVRELHPPKRFCRPLPLSVR